MKKKIATWMILILITISGTISTSPVSSAPLDTQYLYLPLIGRDLTKTIFGGEISVDVISFPSTWPKAVASSMYWVRRNGLLWADVQPNNKDEWNWQVISGLDAELAATSQAGAQTILTIRNTPLWARKTPAELCSAVSAASMADFANFVAAVVARYSFPPYNVKYYEIGNEPDVDPQIMPVHDGTFGCWGDDQDEFYGGGYYADMLKQVYPAVKAVNPQAQVLIGGLLLDCDPTDMAPGAGCAGIYHNAKPPKFFEGILRNGGGAYFDIVNFHGYPGQQTSDINPIVSERSFNSWKSRGGVVLGKIAFLREVMAAYGVYKPIFQTEVALMRDKTYTNIAAFERRKADYVAWVFARGMSQDLLGTTWYTFNGPGWNSSGILAPNQEETPAYLAMKFAVQKLGGTQYSIPIRNYAGLEGFEFNRGGAYHMWVLFSSDNSSPILTLPAGYTKVSDTLGNPITPVNGKITIDHPVYIEFAQ
jgi:hypothetical protein